MSHSFPGSRTARSWSIFAVAVCLLSLFAPKTSWAAEMTFSDSYSLQLPAGWKGELQNDKALIGTGPDDVGFGAKAYPSDISAAEYMDKTLVNTEKRAGYKLIEKTALKTTPDRKAHRVRYQVDGAKGTESLVKFYFQLSQTEVVVLTFQLPNFSSTAAKSDIEAIFNSVKKRTAAGSDDAWGPTPSEKSKGDPKTSGSENSDSAAQVLAWMKAAGIYVDQREPTNYMTLKADGTCSLHQKGVSQPGTYTINGTVITFKFGDDEDTGKLVKDTLVDQGGHRWVKKP